MIFTYSEQPDPALHEQAWAAALVLMAFVLVASVLAKGTARPQPQKAGDDDRELYDPVAVIDSRPGSEGR